jgi:hypothetical protein
MCSESTDTRVTSSIYSRDDSEVRFVDGNVPPPPTSPMRDYAEYSRYAEDEPNISPPDTPVNLAGAQRYSDVSPIEIDSHFFAEVPKNKSSHLPVPQKHYRGSPLPKETARHQAKPSGNRGFEGVSNESTTASRSVTPQEPRTVGTTDPRSKDASKLLSAGKEKLQMLSKPRDQKPKQQQSREQWKGASGRFPLVPPIDTKSLTKNNKQPRPNAQRDTENNHHSYTGHNAHTITTVSTGNPMPEKPRSKAGQFRLHSRTASPATRDSPRELEQKTSPVFDEKATKQSIIQFQSEIEAPTPALEKPEEPIISDMFHDLNVAHEPRSRFSASTYAPTEAVTTPPGSSHADAPPVPLIDYSPIMTRRRPVPSSAASIKSMKRKPVSAETPTLPEADTESMSPEQQAQRRVDSLETRRRQLSLRKDSIRTMLHELTEVIQPSSIAYDMATRDEVKKTVSSLKAELDDIGKEDHEIGLKLVRLYKNLNSASEFEHSTLWVKRVTS